MKRLIECTCGHRHEQEFDNQADWLSINQACCPACTAAPTTHQLVTAELMTLGTHDGMVGSLGFWSLTAVFSFIPFVDTWDSVAGSSERSLAVTAVLADGSYFPLRQSVTAGYADNRQDYTDSAPSIGEQIACLEVKGLEFVLVEDDQNGYEEWREYLPLQPLDLGKIRRRIEDALRKTGDPKILVLFAQKLGVKID